MNLPSEESVLVPPHPESRHSSLFLSMPVHRSPSVRKQSTSWAIQTDQSRLRIWHGSLASSESQYCAVGGFYENRIRVGMNRSVWAGYTHDLPSQTVGREQKIRGLREKFHFSRSQTPGIPVFERPAVVPLFFQQNFAVHTKIRRQFRRCHESFPCSLELIPPCPLPADWTMSLCCTPHFASP